jgi:hypothetical protein
MPVQSAEVRQGAEAPTSSELGPRLDRLHHCLDRAEDGQAGMQALLEAEEPELSTVQEGSETYFAALDEVIELLGELSAGDIPATLQTEPRWPALAHRLSRLWESHTQLMDRLHQHQQAVGERLRHLRQGARSVSGYAGDSRQPQARFLDHSG